MHSHTQFHTYVHPYTPDAVVHTFALGDESKGFEAKGETDIGKRK